MDKREAMALGARCDQCPLGKVGTPTPSTPSSRLRLAIVGDNPSRTDENRREVFSGMSAKVLDSALRNAGIKRSECWIGNVALCRGDSDKENDKAAECCAPRLLRELETLPKTVSILSLGKAPLKAIVGASNLLVARGFVWELKEIAAAHVTTTMRAAQRGKTGPKQDTAILKAETLAGRAKLAGRKVIPSIHPSFVLRADTWGAVFSIDVGRMGRLLRGELGGPLEDDCPYHVGGLEVLRKLRGEVISLDVETDGIDPMTCKMLCVGMSDGKNTAVLWPWKKKYAPALSRFLKRMKAVVCHNGIYDIPVLRNHGVQ